MAPTRAGEKVAIWAVTGFFSVRPRESGDPEPHALSAAQRLDSRFRGNERSVMHRQSKSLRHLRMTAAARNVEEHLLQILAAVARQQLRRRAVILDAALLHDDDALAQPLDLVHVVRSQQD